MKRIIYLVFLTFCVSSCVQIRGVTDDYYHLTLEQKESVVSFNKADQLSRKYIYKVNASTLLDVLKEYPKAFVYVTNVSCTADACLPLNTYENYAKNNNYKVFFFLVGYNDLEVAFAEPIQEPLFVIDSDYYGRKLFRKYVDHFENELMGKEKKTKRTSYESLHFFENGVYKGSHTYLPSIK